MAVPTPTFIEGGGRADNINQSGLVIDMENRIDMLDESVQIFDKLTRVIGGPVEKTRMEYNHREKRLVPRLTTIDVADAIGQAQIEVADPAYVHVDDLLYIPDTQDLLLVTSVNSNGAIGIVDATDGSGTLPSATTVGMEVLILGESHAEGEEAPAAYSVQEEDVTDYIMQMDRRIEATDIEEAEEHYDPMAQRALDRKCGTIEWLKDRNLLFYVGKSTREVASASGPRRHCLGGFFERVNTNTYDFSGGGASLTLQQIGEMLRATSFHTASTKKVSVCGNQAWSAISNLPVSSIRVSPNEKKWGIKVSELMTGYGAVDVSYDPVLSDENGLGDRMIITDPAHIRQTFLRTKGMKMHLNVANLSSVHRAVDVITGTFGLQVKLEELHAQAEGISA
jgi:hypothetical protein